MEDEKRLEYAVLMAKDAYDKQSSQGVDKYFIKGDFPILFNKRGDILYIAVRGTNNNFTSFTEGVDSIRNMLIDCMTADVLGENTSLGEYDVFSRVLTKDKASLTAHMGFIEELGQYYNRVKEEIQLYSGFVKEIVLSGHSAGGAMSSLLYYVYENDITLRGKRIPIANVYTFGSPRVIRDSEVNLELYRENCNNLVRVFNANDIVSYVPLHKSTSWGGSTTSGFIHIGKPLPLDTNIENNSLNALVLQVLRGNKDKFDEIFKKYDFDTIRQNEIIALITSDEYLSLMSESLFTSYKNMAVKEDITDDMLRVATGKLLTDSQELLDYTEKANLGTPLGISDILRNNNIFDSEVQQDVGITGIIGSLFGYNKLSVAAHNLDMYIENVRLLNQSTIYDATAGTLGTPEKQKYALPLVPEPVDMNSLYNKLIAKLLEEIDSDTVVGAVEIDATDLPAVITY